jgi:nucleotide-binding universal stress UspA family protein
VILVCYDGSEAAQAAADEAIRLFHERPATVITVYEPSSTTLVGSRLRLGSAFGSNYQHTEHTAEVDARLRKRAQGTAQEGARRLSAAGMVADYVVEESSGSVARTVLAAAQRAEAEAVIVGAGAGVAGRSALHGRVSDDLVKHADRAVLVVPSGVRARRIAGFPAGAQVLVKQRLNAIALTPIEHFRRDCELSGEELDGPDAQPLIPTALQHGFQTRSAELDLAQVLCELTVPAP